MKTRLSRTLAPLLLGAVVVLLPGRFAGHAHLQEPAAVIDPAVLDALQHQAEVDVVVSLKPPDMPLAQMTVADLRQNAAGRQARVLSVLTDSDFTLVYQNTVVGTLSGRVTLTGVENLASHPDVLYVRMKIKVSADLSESVPLIKADQTRYIVINGAGVDVAVFDTGIDTNHPDLSDSLRGEFCFTDVDSDLFPCPHNPAHPKFDPFHPAEDDHGHGTHVSGTITSNGGTAPFGVAHEAGIFAYKVLDINRDGSSDSIDAALTDIMQSGRWQVVDFINMSFSDDLAHGPGACPSTPAIDLEIGWLWQNGVLAFGSAGNQGSGSGIGWPACLGSVVAVGAVYDADIGPDPLCPGMAPQPDEVPCWSNSSDDLELVGPGCQIRSTARGGGEEPQCGTSRAVPHAVGVATLLEHARPGLPPTEIKNRLKKTGKWVFDDLANRWTPRVDARVAFLVDDAADFDGDGCSTGKEFGDDETLGGRRNPVDPWDFYDVGNQYGYAGKTGAKDGIIDLFNDVILTMNAFENYNVAADRGPRDGRYHWNMTAPDMVVDLFNDIVGVINQVGHDCTS